MVLNVGLVSACIVYKNRAGAQTRLQKLQRKLKQKPISQKTLYSYPVKKIFSIVMIACFMLGLILFLREFEKEVMEEYKAVGEVVEQNEHEEKTHYFFPYRPLNIIEKFQKPTNNNNHTHSSLITSLTSQHRYLKVQKTIHYLLAFFSIPLIVLMCSLQFQRVLVKTKSLIEPNDVSGRISRQKLSLFSGWCQTKQLICKVDDTLVIEHCGEVRFSNTNFYYAIKKISKTQTQENQDISMNSKQQVGQPLSTNDQNVPKVHEQVIMQKGNIYEARQALIYLCHVLKKDINLSIKNGPVKQTKVNKSKLPKKGKTQE